MIADDELMNQWPWIYFNCQLRNILSIIGAIVSSSRGVLYKHLDIAEYDGTSAVYKEIVRKQAQEMRRAVYAEFYSGYPHIIY